MIDPDEENHMIIGDYYDESEEIDEDDEYDKAKSFEHVTEGL